MEIFDIIKKLCEERNITISALEKDLGFSRGSIYKMVTSAPSSDKLKKLADYFDVTTDYLLGRNGKNEANIAPTYDNLLKIYTRSKNNLTLEEKIKLAQIILSDRNDQ